MKAFKKIIPAIALLFALSIGVLVGYRTTVAAKGEATMTENDFIVYGATSVIDTENGYTAGSPAIALSVGSAKAGVYFTPQSIQSMPIGSDVIVDLRMKIGGTGRSDGTLKLYTTADKLIDYGFEYGVWNRVRYEAKVFEKDGVKQVLLAISSARGKEILLSDVTIEAYEKPESLLGGAVLYQIEATSNLMESYVLEAGNGEIVVMDGGDTADAADLVDFIRTFTNNVSHWFLSHYHSDHINAIINIINEYDIHIENLYFDFPSTDTIIDLSGDADYLCVRNINNALSENPNKVTKVIQPKRGDVIEVGLLKIKVLNDAWFEKNSNYGNNTTVVYKVETPGEHILFLGDLGDIGDKYLEDEFFYEEIKTCSIIQLSHHGQNGTTDAFYAEIVNPKICLYAAKQWIYDNSNGTGFNTANLTTLHMRDIVREWGVTTIYTQADGRVRIA